MPKPECQTNVKAQSSNVKLMSNPKDQMPNQRNTYDLEERTARFGEAVIELARSLVQNPINNPLVSQVVRAATSVGANYMEADGAESKKDFRHKISICKKEAKEAKHWLRMIAKANPGRQAECQQLSNEAHELTLIFSSILLSKK
jgi:four helix bundle protein